MSEIALANDTLLDIDSLNIGKPKRRDAKLTRRKRVKFLQEFAKDYNLTRAAHTVGVNRRSIYDLLERDEGFKEAFDEIENAVLDQVESSMIIVASQPSREGFNDRKLLLQSKRREVYGNNPEVQVNVQVNSFEAASTITNLTTKIPASEK